MEMHIIIIVNVYDIETIMSYYIVIIYDLPYCEKLKGFCFTAYRAVYHTLDRRTHINVHIMMMCTYK
jgi:hypothetical protein